MRTTWFKDKAGEWRWHTEADNNEIVADSGEGYEQPDDAINGFFISQNFRQDAEQDMRARLFGRPTEDLSQIDTYTLDWDHN